MVTTLDGATKDDRSPDRRRIPQWEGTATERQIAMWSARVLFGIGVAYAVVMVVGFSAMGNFSKPLQDPYLAIAEALILLMAPTMVMLMAVVHTCAPARTRIYSINALGWMLLTAGFTMTVRHAGWMWPRWRTWQDQPGGRSSVNLAMSFATSRPS